MSLFQIFLFVSLIAIMLILWQMVEIRLLKERNEIAQRIMVKYDKQNRFLMEQRDILFDVVTGKIDEDTFEQRVDALHIKIQKEGFVENEIPKTV